MLYRALRFNRLGLFCRVFLHPLLQKCQPCFALGVACVCCFLIPLERFVVFVVAVVANPNCTIALGSPAFCFCPFRLAHPIKRMRPRPSWRLRFLLLQTSAARAIGTMINLLERQSQPFFCRFDFLLRRCSDLNKGCHTSINGRYHHYDP